MQMESVTCFTELSTRRWTCPPPSHSERNTTDFCLDMMGEAPSIQALISTSMSADSPWGRGWRLKGLRGGCCWQSSSYGKDKIGVYHAPNMLILLMLCWIKRRFGHSTNFLCIAYCLSPKRPIDGEEIISSPRFHVGPT